MEEIAPSRIPPGLIRLVLVVTVLLIVTVVLLSLTGVAVGVLVALLGGTSPTLVLDTPTRAASSAPASVPTPTPTWSRMPTATPTYAKSSASASPSTPTPTWTKMPTPTFSPTATPTPACAFRVQGPFASLWQTYQTQLGCPLQRQPQAIHDAEQLFQNGHMFWREDNNYAYVVYEEGERSGTFQAFTGLWSQGDPEYSCSASPPAGLVQPQRGFGAVWCQLGAASAPIGWALGGEGGFGPGNGDPLAQDFEQGIIFRDSDGKTRGMAYVLFEDGTFVRVRY